MNIILENDHLALHHWAHGLYQSSMSQFPAWRVLHTELNDTVAGVNCFPAVRLLSKLALESIRSSTNSGSDMAAWDISWLRIRRGRVERPKFLPNSRMGSWSFFVPNEEWRIHGLPLVRLFWALLWGYETSSGIDHLLRQTKKVVKHLRIAKPTLVLRYWISVPYRIKVPLPVWENHFIRTCEKSWSWLLLSASDPVFLTPARQDSTLCPQDC